MNPKQFYDNLRNDRGKVQTLVDELKSGGFEVYATGSSLAHSDYNDIDLVVKPQEGMTSGDIENQLELAVGSIEEQISGKRPRAIMGYESRFMVDFFENKLVIFPSSNVDEMFEKPLSTEPHATLEKYQKAVKKYIPTEPHATPENYQEAEVEHMANPIEKCASQDNKPVILPSSGVDEIDDYGNNTKSFLEELRLRSDDDYCSSKVINRRELNIGGTKLDITVSNKPFELNPKADYVKL